METQLELSMTDQQSDSSEAKLTLSLTGNPWTDFGIVSLCEELALKPMAHPSNRTIVELKQKKPMEQKSSTGSFYYLL